MSEAATSAPLPRGKPRSFRVTVHGTCFGGREKHLAEVNKGDMLRLIVDPPVQDDPQVWVHLFEGPPVGHLPPEVNTWMAAWLSDGGAASAQAVSVRGAEAPSWRRLVIRIDCVDPLQSEGLDREVR